MTNTLKIVESLKQGELDNGSMALTVAEIAATNYIDQGKGRPQQ